MNPPTTALERIELSAAHARRLTTLGMVVVVALDGGGVAISELTMLPWQLGHGGWVAKTKHTGAGGLCCSRIKPQ